jgi:hapalindole-type alkaloid chlorinase
MDSFFPLARWSGKDPVPVGTLDAIHARELAGVVLEGVFDAGELQRGVEGVERSNELTRHAFSPRFEAYSYGEILDHSGADRTGYHNEATLITRVVTESFGEPFVQQLGARLGALADPRPLVRPSSASGVAYAPFTVRSYPEGGLIPPHCELEQLRRESYRDLLPQICADTLLSFLVMVSAPEAGGDLVVYDLDQGDPRVPEFYSDRSVVHSIRDGFLHERIPLSTGDLLVFDAGRHFHQILPVLGKRTRWTLGGFMAPLRDRSAWFYWS